MNLEENGINQIINTLMNLAKTLNKFKIIFSNLLHRVKINKNNNININNKIQEKNKKKIETKKNHRTLKLSKT